METQSLYFDHCDPGIRGSGIEEGVQTQLHCLEGYRTPINYITKAQDHLVGSYSAFADNQYHRFTDLNSKLTLHGVNTLVVTGLITNACVRGKCINGIKLAYEVVLIEDATETVSASLKARPIMELEGWGVQIMNLTEGETAHPTGLQKGYLKELWINIYLTYSKTCLLLATDLSKVRIRTTEEIRYYKMFLQNKLAANIEGIGEGVQLDKVDRE